MQTAAAIAVKADRERIAAIMTHPEAKGREGLASTLATAGLSVDQAKAALAVAPIGPAAVTAMWEGVLASRGMTSSQRILAAASPWDDVMQRKGFEIGG